MTSKIKPSTQPDAVVQGEIVPTVNSGPALRQRAEAVFLKNSAQSSENLNALSPEAARQMLHELQVHQIELELQNEELRRTQVELEASRERYFDLYDLAPVGYCTVSEKGLILQANLQLATLLGVVRGALIQRPFSDFISKQDQGTYYLLRKPLFETGEPQVCDLRMLKLDGTQSWVHLVASAAQDAGGARVGRIVLTDIEERKQADEALRESEARLRDITFSIADWVWEVDENGVYTYSSQQGFDFFGPSREDVIGKTPFDFMPPDEARRVAAIFSEIAANKAPIKDLENWNIGKSGQRICLLTNGVPMLDRAGNLKGHRGVDKDITEKKRAEVQIQHYLAQLQSAFMSTVEVATTLSELRDPYTAGHERRVGKIAVAIGAELGLDDSHIEGLRVAGYLHDIGKISIPAEILSKPGKLSEIEFKLIQGHAQSSYDVLKDVKFPWPVAQVALQHHERLDGSGYPRGLKGEAILFEARILAVADVVEAMSSHRPYRAGLGIEAAMTEIERGSGTRYDPTVAGACLKLFREKGYAIPA